MILSCNSCEKRFVVPDNAITAAGRMVQCGSCGNKWKQFPQTNEVSITKSSRKINNKSLKTKKSNKKNIKKKREMSLYSPEYLENKHGITLNQEKTIVRNNSNTKISFGFYNYLIIFSAILVFLTGVLINTQEIIITNFPSMEIYINYFFESLKNIKTIIKGLINFD